MRILLCLVGLAVGTWLVPVPVLSLTGDLTNDPAQVIKKYLSLDKRGVRLTAHTYEAVKPYVAWEQEEPAWKRFVVIRDYSVIDDVTQWDIVSSTEARHSRHLSGSRRRPRGNRHVRVPTPREERVHHSHPGRGQSLENGVAGVSSARRPEPLGRFRERRHAPGRPMTTGPETLRRLREALIKAGRS